MPLDFVTKCNDSWWQYRCWFWSGSPELGAGNFRQTIQKWGGCDIQTFMTHLFPVECTPLTTCFVSKANSVDNTIVWLAVQCAVLVAIKVAAGKMIKWLFALIDKCGDSGSWYPKGDCIILVNCSLFCWNCSTGLNYYVRYLLKWSLQKWPHHFS